MAPGVAPPPLDSTGPGNEDPGHRADLGSKVWYPEPKPVQAGLYTPVAQAWGSTSAPVYPEVSAGLPTLLKCRNPENTSAWPVPVLVPVLACGQGQWLPGGVVVRGMCYILQLLFIGPAWRGSRGVSGQVAQVGGKVEMWDHQVEAMWESAPHGAD